MDFIDYRKGAEKKSTNQNEEIVRKSAGRLRGRMRRDYIEEIIQEAQSKGEFDNLPGAGKPLNLDEEYELAGEKAMAYHLLKENNAAPAEIELIKEIRALRKKAEAKITPVIHRGKTLRNRRIAPFASERAAYNEWVERATVEYEKDLREINKRILTLNISVPPAMQQSFLDVDRLLAEFRAACPQL
ncbi:DnaJ family protein C protein 28 [Thermosporothrix hazakensis]|jgi:hypothetical protein|uniref:DnaJ family protein C protein 28 n=2 Tax=Thermosporothrix TaxID=768650 RepID=A0A326U727_THEHA|nr:DUF1992 domain-containing protein [Thermosporothrix hazakensis]PZW30598.1 DnaJ family protein C protein 28 [Thermosporothrix hazakensis]BBH91313.1 hypothetical protein KTC_60640 [Thermosporothrix sp. COM3]GCE49460.1 hypothetical protein KTH_43290 [Thermosporothrix hazakensis]